MKRIIILLVIIFLLVLFLCQTAGCRFHLRVESKSSPTNTVDEDQSKEQSVPINTVDGDTDSNSK